MTSYVIPVQCSRCKHLGARTNKELDRMNCEAFPDGIPDAIYTGEHDHRKPYRDDNGIRFESIDDKEKRS